MVYFLVIQLWYELERCLATLFLPYTFINCILVGRKLCKFVRFAEIMLWATATLCFFGFFRAGEIIVPSLTSFEPTKHLAWGDVAVDDAMNLQALRVYQRPIN